MWRAYSRALKAAPVRTNVLTATFVTATGDALAQTLAAWPQQQQRAASAAEPGSATASLLPPPFAIDLERSATVTAYWAVTAPALYGWFRWLDAKFPTGAATGAGRQIPTARGLATLGKKLLVHQWTFVPVLNGCFFAYLVLAEHTLQHKRAAGARNAAAAAAPVTAQQRQDSITLVRIMQQQSSGVLQQRLCDEVPSRLREAQKTSVVVWGVAHTFNFMFLPPYTRVLFNSSVGVIWSAYLSIVGHRMAVHEG